MLEHELETSAQQNPPTTLDSELTAVVITLLKGLVTKEADSQAWNNLIKLQIRVRDYIKTLNLELFLDETEGYAFLKTRQSNAETPDTIPRLISRRALSYHVSLLLALLRKKLTEFDATGGDTRLILTRQEIVQLIQVFLPDSTNEVKVLSQVDTNINKVVELGFLRRLKAAAGKEDAFEVRRMLRAFVDTQWLDELDKRLEQYQQHIAGQTGDDHD